MTQLFLRLVRRTALPAAVALAGVAFSGCEQKEKEPDIKTPNSTIEVERSKDTGSVDIEVETRRGNRVEIETARPRLNPNA